MTPSSTDGTRIIRASMLNQIVWYAQPNRLSVSCGLTEKVDPNRGKCSTRSSNRPQYDDASSVSTQRTRSRRVGQCSMLEVPATEVPASIQNDIKARLASQ